jgi:cation:H+ antiporter
MLIDGLLFFCGLLLLYVGADSLVKGAARLAILARIKPIVIGVTVVAFGTSSPEFIVSFVAALSGYIDVASGNIVGSNIANIGLILGVSGLIKPIIIEKSIISRETYWMLGASLLFWIFAANGLISQIEGWILFAGIIGFTLILVRQSISDRRKQELVPEVDEGKHKAWPLWKKAGFYSIQVIGGIGILVWGSDITVKSATNIAYALNISEVLIGLSLVAFGTSLPELATAIISIIRREKAILIGNIIGSNIFNILFVGGTLAGVFGIPISPRMVTIDLPLMLLISLLLLPIILKTNRISRIFGFLLLAYYVLYILFIYLNA